MAEKDSDTGLKNNDHIVDKEENTSMPRVGGLNIKIVNNVEDKTAKSPSEEEGATGKSKSRLENLRKKAVLITKDSFRFQGDIETLSSNFSDNINSVDHVDILNTPSEEKITPDHLGNDDSLALLESDNLVLSATVEKNASPKTMMEKSDALSIKSRTINYGVIVSAVWIGICLIYSVFSATMASFQMSAFVSTLVMPLILVWFIIGHFDRQKSITDISASLRKELKTMLFPSEDQSSVIQKEVEQLCSQALEVSETTRELLLALQKARKGLRYEMRTYLETSEMTEERMDRLSGAFSGKTADLKTYIESLDQEISALLSKVDNESVKWKKESSLLTEQTREIGETLEKGAQHIEASIKKVDAVSLSLDGRFENITETVDKTVNRIENSMDSAEKSIFESVERLSVVGCDVADEIKDVSSTIRAQIDDFEQATEETVELLGTSVSSLEKYKTSLSDGVQSLSGEVSKVSDTMEGSLGRLDVTLKHMEEKTADLYERLDKKSEDFLTVVNKFENQTQNIEVSGERLTNMMGEALSMAVSGADSIGLSVRRSVSLISEETERAIEESSNIYDAAQACVENIVNKSQNTIDTLQMSVGDLGDELGKIEAISLASKNNINELSKLLENQSEKIKGSFEALFENIDTVRGSLERPLDDIQKAVDRTSKQYSSIDLTLSKRIDDLNKVSDKAMSAADAIRLEISEKNTDLTSLSGALVGHLRAINDTLNDQKGIFDNSLKSKEELFEKFKKTIDDDIKFLTSVSDKALLSIQDINGNLSSQISELSEQTSGIVETLIGVDTNITDRLANIKIEAKEVLSAMTDVHSSLGSTVSTFEPLCEKAMEDADKITQRFEKLREDFDTKTESKIAKLLQIGIVFDNRLKSLQEGAEKASVLMKESSKYVKEGAAEISDVSSSTMERMEKIGARFKDQSEDIHLITDQAILKMKDVQGTIDNHFKDLSSMISHSMTRLDGASKAFVSQSELVNKETDKALKYMQETGHSIQMEGDQIGKKVREMAFMSSNLVEKVNIKTQTLLDSTKESLETLNQTGDKLTIRAREIKEQIIAAKRTSETYGRDLQNQAAKIAETSLMTSEQMSKAVSVLNSNLGSIGKAAQDAIIKIKETKEDLEDESGRIMQVSEAAMQASSEASDNFSKQSQALFKVVREASAFAQEIDESKARSERGAFLASAKFIIESLHSISVDLSRSIEGDISEKTWKAFQRGDISAFTRKLAMLDLSGGNVDGLQTAKEKFEKDTRFRTYVNSFSREFETLYAQAIANDHGALLSSTLATSDIARLYDCLCKVSGKKSVMVGEKLKSV